MNKNQKIKNFVLVSHKVYYISGFQIYNYVVISHRSQRLTN